MSEQARTLIEAASPQVVGYDDICHGIEHELNVVRVRGTRHVAIDLLRRGLVLRLELGLDVGGRLPVLLSACEEGLREWKKSPKETVIRNRIPGKW